MLFRSTSFALSLVGRVASLLSLLSVVPGKTTNVLIAMLIIVLITFSAKVRWHLELKNISEQSKIFRKVFKLENLISVGFVLCLVIS